MIYYVTRQALNDAYIFVQMTLTTGAPDTGATLTVQPISPLGYQVSPFTQPTVAEVYSGSGLYRLVFNKTDALPLFTNDWTSPPYLLSIKSASASAGIPAFIMVYCVTTLPRDFAPGVSLAAIEGSTVLAKASILTKLTKFITNKKALMSTAGVTSLIVYDDDNTTEILRKTITDISGGPLSVIGAGVIAQEAKSSI